jgi:hypothetical protein
MSIFILDHEHRLPLGPPEVNTQSNAHGVQNPNADSDEISSVIAVPVIGDKSNSQNRENRPDDGNQCEQVSVSLECHRSRF